MCACVCVPKQQKENSYATVADVLRFTIFCKVPVFDTVNEQSFYLYISFAFLFLWLTSIVMTRPLFENYLMLSRRGGATRSRGTARV